MRSRNRKVNSIGSGFDSVGKVGCLGLLVLSLALVNPVTSAVYAWDSAPDGGGESATGYGNVGTGGGGTVSRASTVSIAFSPSAGEASVSPVTEAGVAARTMVLATVGVQNSGGYSVYLKSNNQNLTGKKTGEVIAPITGSVAYANLVANTWGYAAAEGTTVADTATYKAVSTSGNGALVGENKASNIVNESKTFALSFAAKIGSDKPADTYENQVMLSVVSAPLQVAGFSGIQTMQEMTTSACSAAEIGDEVQLRDTRDGKFYWVSKLADGKCWMTQNLDLDLSTAKYLSPSDSDVTSNWTPGYTTATIVGSSTILASNTGQRSWSLGDYRITNPNTSSECRYPKNSAADCSAQFTAYATPTSANGDVNAHYILGNHYQWNAATAGTGGTITSGTASGSICPKGWKLPTSNTDGEFAALVTALGGTSSTNNVTKAPFYGVRGGYVDQVTSYLFAGAGAHSYYWSSTPVSNANSARIFFFYGADNVDPSSNTNRSIGSSVRCVAK